MLYSQYIFRDQYGRPAWAGRGNRDGNFKRNEPPRDGRSRPPHDDFHNDERGSRRGFQDQK